MSDCCFAFYSTFWIPTEAVYLQHCFTATWLKPCETAAASITNRMTWEIWTSVKKQLGQYCFFCCCCRCFLWGKEGVNGKSEDVHCQHSWSTMSLKSSMSFFILLLLSSFFRHFPFSSFSLFVCLFVCLFVLCFCLFVCLCCVFVCLFYFALFSSTPYFFSNTA